MTILTVDNPYLLGAYAPVDTEITADDLKVIGEIPHDLNGMVVRNGPNPHFSPPGLYHWFDGDGMLHSVTFRNGTASYRNRWVRTDHFKRENSARKALWSGLLETFSTNPPDAPLKDTANTDVIFHNSSLLALWYLSGKPYKVDPLTLETVGVADFQGLSPCKVAAHAKVDEQTGELFFFDFGPRPPFLTYGVASADGKLAHLAPIELPGPRLPHDIAITEQYSILFDFPVFNEPEAMRRGRFKSHFYTELPSRYGIIPRYGDNNSIRWFEGEPCYIYHTMNAWEEGNEIVLFGCRVSKPVPIERKEDNIVARMMAFLRLEAQACRWRFNLDTGKMTEELLDDAQTDFPSMNQFCVGRKSRFSYNMHMASQSTLVFDGIVKYDLEVGNSETHWLGPGQYGSESPFAPRPNHNSEDDGYVLSFVYDEPSNCSELHILDAQNISAQPIGRVCLPQRVPAGFHACWVPGEKIWRG